MATWPNCPTTHLGWESFTALHGCAVCAWKRRCFRDLAVDFVCCSWRLGLDLCTNLTLVAERCLILGALVLGLLALLGPGCGALRKELLVELYCLINPKGIDQLTFLEFTLDVVEYGFWIC